MDAIKKRAKHADLISFPPAIKSINCFNCRFTKGESGDQRYCRKKDVAQYVTSQMCCNYWDHEGTTRSWENEKEEMSHISPDRINEYAKNK